MKNTVKISAKREIVLRVYIPNEFALEFSGEFVKQFPIDNPLKPDNTRVTCERFENKTSRWVMKVTIDETQENSFNDFLISFSDERNLSYESIDKN